MGTYWKARVVETDGLSAARAVELLTTTFGFVVAKMSPWKAGSDLARYREAEAGDWIRMDPATIQVLSRASDVAELTGGLFDPTIGRLTDALGFGPSGIENAVLPKSPEAELARLAAGFHRLRLDRAACAVFQPGGFELDLCSIAKGFAVDLALEKLVAAGVRSCFVEIGGEARGVGCKPDGQPWWCRIESPTTPNHGLPETVAAACGLALATSGNTLRKRPVPGGGELGHIISPRLERPLDPALESVTVTADTCMEADAWATALYLLGSTEGLALATQQNLSALFVIRDTCGYREAYSPRFASLLD